MIGRFLGQYAKNAGYALLFGRFLQSKSGARLQNSRQIGQWLNARNTGLLIDGDQGRLSERVSFQNVCVTASVGTGKTTRYIIPNVLDKAGQNCSIVVNDPKGEVFDVTSGYMQSRGFEVVVINPETGIVEAEVALSGLLPDSDRRKDTDVLNGIAQDPETGAIWVTGKRWPKLFQIKLEPRH